MAAVALAVMLVLAASVMSNDSPNASLLEADSMPDPSDKQGQYDWKKCKESGDPNCWKEEGERVGNWWHNFGQRMKSHWANLFGKKDNVAEETTTENAAVETTEEPKAKKHKKAAETSTVEEPKS